MIYKYGKRTRLLKFKITCQHKIKRELKTFKLSLKLRRFVYYLGSVFNKTIIPLALVGCEMIIANSGLCASLAIYHLISNACSWNNC